MGKENSQNRKDEWKEEEEKKTTTKTTRSCSDNA